MNTERLFGVGIIRKAGVEVRPFAVIDSSSTGMRLADAARETAGPRSTLLALRVRDQPRASSRPRLLEDGRIRPSIGVPSGNRAYPYSTGRRSWRVQAGSSHSRQRAGRATGCETAIAPVVVRATAARRAKPLK